MSSGSSKYSRMPQHSCCEMRVMQCMTYFFCASLQVYTSFRSAQNHCPPDNVRPAGGYILGEIDSPTDTDLLLATYRGGSPLTSDIIFMLLPLCCHSSSFTRVIFPLSRHSTNLRTSSGSNCLPASWISFSRATFTGKAFL